VTDSFETLLRFSDGGGLTVETLLLRLLAALVLGQLVAWVYIRSHRGISYAASVAQSLVVMPLIVTLVMAVIGNSLARAFGLFGALALIRFRTPVKDARDTVFLFVAVAIGIATGTGNIVAALIGTLVIGFLLWRLQAAGFGTRLGHDGLLRYQVPAAAADTVQDVLARHCDTVRLLHVRDAGADALEVSLEIGLGDRDFAPRVLAAVREVAGVTDVSLLMQDTETAP